MIIVSQDKKIINFERLNYIQVSKVGEKKNLVEINHSDCNYLVIGEYKTAERANEVLEEIKNTFSASLLNGTHDEIDLILKAKFMARYEMPKE